MPVTVVTNQGGAVWIVHTQGALRTECFFKAVDETTAELRHMGYQQLITRYPVEEITVGQGIEPEDLEDLFLEADA